MCLQNISFCKEVKYVLYQYYPTLYKYYNEFNKFTLEEKGGMSMSTCLFSPNAPNQTLYLYTKLYIPLPLTFWNDLRGSNKTAEHWAAHIKEGDR